MAATDDVAAPAPFALPSDAEARDSLRLRYTEIGRLEDCASWRVMAVQSTLGLRPGVRDRSGACTR